MISCICEAVLHDIFVLSITTKSTDMNLQSKLRNTCLIIFLLAGFTTNAQTTSNNKKANVMKTYLIQRDIPGAGQFDAATLKGISQKSCSVLEAMGPGIKWVHSYVTGNNIFCIYQAENEELLKEHAAKGGFPINKITEVSTTISPETAK